MNGQEFSRQLNLWKTKRVLNLILLPPPIQSLVFQYATCKNCEWAKQLEIKNPSSIGFEYKVTVDKPHLYYLRETLEIVPLDSKNIFVNFEVDNMSCYSCGSEHHQDDFEMKWSTFLSCLTHNVSLPEIMRTSENPCHFESFWNVCEASQSLYHSIKLLLL